ncbi:MAG: hypothetical protein PUC86_06070, partial [Solobacterium sp.]|nr:hypothetical protein [Solobacterium sp.]
MLNNKNKDVIEEAAVEEEINMDDPSLFTLQRADDSASEHIAAPKYSYWGSVFRRFFSNKLAITMLIIVVAVLLMALIHPMISHYDNMVTPNINNKAMHYVRPGVMDGYIFGTDDKGNNL